MVTEEYPTQEDLAYIEGFDCTTQDVRRLVDFIEGVWWRPDWGLTRKTVPTVFCEAGLEQEKKDCVLELHTGGWSGNEDILRALRTNKWFYAFYWEKSERGGHEYFRFNHLQNWEVSK